MRIVPILFFSLFASATASATVAPSKPEPINFLSIEEEDRARIIAFHHLSRIDNQRERVFEAVRLFQDFRRVLGEREMGGYSRETTMPILAETMHRRSLAYTYDKDQSFYINLSAGRYPLTDVHYSDQRGSVRIQVAPVGYQLRTPAWEENSFDLTGNEEQNIVSRIDYRMSPHYAYVAAWAPKFFVEVPMSRERWEELKALEKSTGDLLALEHEGGRMEFSFGACQDFEPPGYRGRVAGCWMEVSKRELQNVVIPEPRMPELDAEGNRLQPERKATFHARDAVPSQFVNRTDVPNWETWPSRPYSDQSDTSCTFRCGTLDSI